MNVQPRFKLPQNSSSSLHHRRKSSVSIHPKTSKSSECLFCTRKLKESFYPKMIVKALYSKFASSQNYYYTRDINDILANNRTRAVIIHKDNGAYIDESEEYLKRYYQINENSFKMKLLVEYYKFHKDIPRQFMLPTCDVLNRYHDKKRRLEYVRIKKMLKEQEKQENRSIVSDTNIQETGNSNQDSDKKPDPKLKIPLGNVLEGLDLEKEETPKRNPTEQLAKMLNKQGSKCEISNSYSLLDFNKKLLDLTEQRSELFAEEKNAKFHDLSNFLAFLKTSKARKKNSNLEELSEIQKEITESGFCLINLPMKPVFSDKTAPKNGKKPTEIATSNLNKDIFAGIKKLDLSKLKQTEENLNNKANDSRPLSSNRKINQQPPSNSHRTMGVLNFQNQNLRDQIKTQRNFNVGVSNGLYKINSERTTYEKKTKNFVEIANEAANRIINKSQNILKKDILIINNQKAISGNNNANPKGNHNRVNSLYCNNSNAKTQTKFTSKDMTGSPNLKNSPSLISYNNFFQTRTALKKETPEDTYNFSKNTTNSKNKKISHKYTKSDPNLLLPKMSGTNINNSNSSNNNNNNQGPVLFSIKENNEKKKSTISTHAKKSSVNLKSDHELKKNPTQHVSSNSNLKNNNQQFYTINQNNILNIYFGEDAKGANIKIKPKAKNIFFGNGNNINKVKN